MGQPTNGLLAETDLMSFPVDWHYGCRPLTVAPEPESKLESQLEVIPSDACHRF
jgi:hypothetical protein